MSEAKEELARRIERELDREFEGELRRSEKIKRRHARIKKLGAARRSGKSPSREHRSVDADLRLLRAIKASVRDGDEINLVRRSGPAVEDFRKQKTRRHLGSTTKSTSSKPRPARHTTGSPLPRITRRYWCPGWDHATAVIKALAWSKVTYVGEAYTINVNLGAEVVRAIQAKGPGFAKRVRDRISQHLRRRMEPLGAKVPEFFLWIEATRRSGPHVHGVILIPHNRPELLEVVKAALRSMSGNTRANAVFMRRVYEPVGWLAYITKLASSTRIWLGDDNIAAATWGVKREARRWYEEARKGEVPIN